MADEPILPTADQILRHVLDRFYALRPTAFQHINLRTGNYWHPFLGWRAQCAVSLARLLTLVRDNRLSTAEGRALLDYVASEFSAIPETDATFAIGEMTLTRTDTTKSGDIPKGKRFTRKANLTTQMPLQSAEYETLADVHFDVGQSTAGPVPIRAISSGPGANHPIRTDSIPHGVTGANLFDATIAVSAFGAAGGANALSTSTVDPKNDEYVRDFARAYYAGQYGPTSAASRYGALRGAGVRNILVYDLPGAGVQKILVADSSWASSDRWAALIEQSIYDAKLVGNGCKVSVGKIRNKVISASTTVILRDKNYATETTEVDEAVKAAVRSYFDDRVDWNVWKTSALKSAVARCHPKILNCSSVVIKDVTGAVLSETSSLDYNTEQFHFQLANNAVANTYLPPS
jgi:hypothetical protein